MHNYLTFLAFLLTYGLFAQQSPQSSLYNFNTYDFNPAVAGIDGNLSLNGDLRRQWAGFDGSPLTQSINAHLPVYITRGGFGVSFKNFTAGVSQNTQGVLSYNQILQVGKKALISVGVSGGIAQHSFNGSELRTASGTNEPPIVNHNDAELPEFDDSAIAGVLNAGIVLNYENFRLGISADNLLESQFVLSNGQKDVVFNQIRHYYGYLSYEISLDNDLSLKPSVLVKAGGATIQTDVNVAAELRDKFMLGIGYRGYNDISSDAVILQAGFRLSNSLFMRYAFDIGVSEIKTVNSGSHEVLISYDIPTNFGKGTPPQIIYNPRFL